MAYLAQLIDDVVVHKFELTQEQCSIGRKADRDIVIDDNAVSSNHACIRRLPNTYFADYIECFIEDLGSTNGTFLNDVAVVGQQRLRHGDIVRIAWNKFKFVDESEAEMEKTVHMVQTSQGLK